MKKRNVVVTDRMVEKARTYAEAVVDTVRYADSNQHNKEKILFDHMVGKVGEEAVKRFLTDNNLPVKGPDYSIYSGKNKSWESDLYINGIGIAVKTQNTKSAEMYGMSWTFQSSSWRRDPVLDSKEALVFFVLYDNIKMICTIYPPKKIKELRFSRPKLDKYVGKKLVVYEESLL